MKVKIEISGDPKYCCEDSARGIKLCKAWNGHTCLLAEIYAPPVTNDTEEARITTGFDEMVDKYTKCRWCREKFPVKSASSG